MATDPVCKMDVAEATAKVTSDYQGTRYYFCSLGCKESFDRDPDQFLVDSDILGRKPKSS